MKKISELLKPYLSIIFGVLLFLYFFDWLSAKGGFLALGIIAVVLSVCFVGIGLLSILAGDKFSKDLKAMLDSIFVGLFALFMGVYFLIFLIQSSKTEGLLGPNGWTIAIFSISSAFLFSTLFLGAYFSKNKVLSKLALILGPLFILSLIFEVLFNNGTPVTLGNIIVLQVFMFVVYISMLLSAISELKGVKVEAVAEEVKEEPKEEK